MKMEASMPVPVPVDLHRLLGALKDISDQSPLRLGQMIENLSVSRRPGIGTWQRDDVNSVAAKFKHICIMGYLGVDTIEEARKKAKEFIDG